VAKLKIKHQRIIWLGAGIALALILPLPRWLILGTAILWFLVIGWSVFRHLPFINWHVSLALAGKFSDQVLKKRPIAHLSLGLALASQPLAGAIWVIGLLLLTRYGKNQWNITIWPLFTGKSLPGAPVQYWYRPVCLGDVIRLTDVWADYTRLGMNPQAKILCRDSVSEVISLLIGSDNVEVWEDFEWLEGIRKGARIFDLRKAVEIDNDRSLACAFAHYLHLQKTQGYLVFPQEVRRKAELNAGKIWILVCYESSRESKTLAPQTMESLIESLLSQYPNLGICISAKEKNQIAIQHDRLKDLSGRLTLANLLSLMNTVDGIITTDNGSLHLGIALEKPIFAYFSTMPAWKILPTQVRNLTFSEYKGACAPCFTHGDICPATGRDEFFACMQTFPLDAARDWLETTFASKLTRAMVERS
jgi:hypothetical protein